MQREIQTLTPFQLVSVSERSCHIPCSKYMPLARLAAWRTGYPGLQPHPFPIDVTTYNSIAQEWNPWNNSWTSCSVVFLCVSDIRICSWKMCTLPFKAESYQGRWGCRKKAVGVKTPVIKRRKGLMRLLIPTPTFLIKAFIVKRQKIRLELVSEYWSLKGIVPEIMWGGECAANSKLCSVSNLFVSYFFALILKYQNLITN